MGYIENKMISIITCRNFLYIFTFQQFFKFFFIINVMT